MHEANVKWWQYCLEKYKKYFVGENVSVLECGSYNVNGTIRVHFKVGKYVGIDWRAGPCVDVVSLVHKTNLTEKFDTVVSASLLEHDRYWQLTLIKMIEYMKEDGILILTWGAALNPPHCHDESDDNCFHSLPAGQVIQFLETQGIYIHEFHYEGTLPCSKGAQMASPNGMGEVCLVGFKHQKYSIGESIITPLIEFDKFLPKITTLLTNMEQQKALIKQMIKRGETSKQYVDWFRKHYKTTH